MTSTVDAGEPTSSGVGGRYDRGVVALLVGKFGESAGVAALATALGKQVYDLSGRELDLGLLGLAQFAPAALLVLLTGSVADRFDRRRVASSAGLGEVFVTLLVVVYVAGSPTAVGPLFGLTFVYGVFRAFVAPAQRSLPADIVPSERLPWLVARWSIVFQVSMVAGPVLAGMVYALDPVAAFVTIAGLFVLGAVAIRLVPEPSARSATSDMRHGGAGQAERRSASMSQRLHDAMEGLRLLRRQPVLLGAISLDLFAVLFGGAVALLPAIAEERLGVGAVGFGWLRAAPGIGASAVMVLLAIRPVRRHVGRRLLGAVALFGVATIVLGATTNYVVAFAALIVLAGADALSVFIRVTLVPLVTPRDARGRVLAVENVFIGASNELGAFESGVTGQLMGPALAVGFGGVATIAVAATWWRLFPTLRDVDRFPTPEDASAAPDDPSEDGSSATAGVPQAGSGGAAGAFGAGGGKPPSSGPGGAAGASGTRWEPAGEPHTWWRPHRRGGSA